MTVSPRIEKLGRAAAVGGLALAVLTASATGAAFAQDQQQQDPYYNHILNTDKRIFDGILSSIGLKPESRPDIKYRERSPLVIPPSRDLPPPEKSSLTKNPDWPVDPEVKQRKVEAAAEAQSDYVDESAPISGTSRDIWAHPPPGDTADGGPGTKKKEPNFISALLHGKLPLGNKNEVATFTGEPPRETLTEPPPGYLTPSPVAPYGVSGQAAAAETPHDDSFRGR
jgi:hypothetical protein